MADSPSDASSAVSSSDFSSSDESSDDDPRFINSLHCEILSHEAQLSHDDPGNKMFNIMTYKRATLAVMEPSADFKEQQKALGESLRRLSYMQVQSVSMKELPEVQRVRNSSKFSLKRKRDDDDDGDQAPKRKDVLCKPSLDDLLSDASDRSAGFHRVGTISLGDQNLFPQWDGQFQIKADIGKKALNVNVMKFIPEFSDKAKEIMKTDKVVGELQAEMRKNLCRYEMARQFSIQISLNKIEKLCLFAPNGSDSHAFVIVESNEQPKCLQRHTATNLKTHNDWKQRASIFKDLPTAPLYLVLGFSKFHTAGQLIAEMISLEPGLVASYKKTEKSELPVGWYNHKVAQTSATVSIGNEPAPGPSGDAAGTKRKMRIGPKKSKLRKEILDILVEYKIISIARARLVFANPSDSEDKDILQKSKLNNYLGGLKIQDCLDQYVNFICTDPSQLRAQLRRKVQSISYGFETYDALGVKEVDEKKQDVDKNNNALSENQKHDSTIKDKNIGKKTKQSADEHDAKINEEKEEEDDKEREMTKDDVDDEKRDNNVKDDADEQEVKNKVEEEGDETEEEMEAYDAFEEEEEEEDEELKLPKVADKSKWPKIELLTVGEYIHMQRSRYPYVFYSFCLNMISVQDHYSHCSRCHICRKWKYWHCQYCDNCSIGMGITICEFCGTDSENPIVIPARQKDRHLQAYHNQLWGLISSDDIANMRISENLQKRLKREKKISPIEKGWHFSDVEDDVFESPVDQY